MTTSSLEYQISTDQFVRLQNNPGKCFVPPSRYSWAALGALPPCLLPSSPCPALPCPAATWHIALWAACDGVISPLSMNPTGSGSPWLFPVFPRLPALRYHSADKGSLGLPPALSFVPPGSQPCVRSLLSSVLSPLGTSLPRALLLLVQLRGRMAGLC